MFEHAKEKEEIVSLFSQEKRELQEEINAVVAEHNEAMIVAESEKQQELSVKESEKVKRNMADEAIFTLYVRFLNSSKTVASIKSNFGIYIILTKCHWIHIETKILM